MKKLLALLFFASMVNAEPGPASRFLANESASLLDVGMIRLQMLALDFKNRICLHYSGPNEEAKCFYKEVHTDYYADDDKIVVSIGIANVDGTEKQVMEACEEGLAQMNIWLAKELPGLFLHVGDDGSEMPAEMWPSFKDMFELRCYVHAFRDTSEGQFWAHRKLGLPGDRDMTIGRWDPSN